MQMRRVFFRHLIIVICFAAIVTMSIIFAIETYNSQNDYLRMEQVKIEEVKNKIDQNKSSISSLTESLNLDSLSKTMTFAYMIEQNPEIIENLSELKRIKNMLNVDELHVIDENGILSWGTEPQMFGFDFATDEQTKPFLDGIKNKSFSLAQEPQPNATLGVLFQYAGVSRFDKEGVVQIGLRPERLQEALENNKISKVLSNTTVGKNGYVFALNKDDLTIEAYPDSSFIGKPASSIGISENFNIKENKNGFISLNGEMCYYLAEEYDGYIIGAAVSRSEVYSGRNLFCLVVFVLMVIIFGLLLLIVNSMLEKNIISGIHEIINCLSDITIGNLERVVDLHNNKEFSDLSNGINDMVKSIKLKMNELQKLADQENEIVLNIRDVSDDINGLSKNMLDVSNSLKNGAFEQESASEELLNDFKSIAQQVKNTSDKAQETKNFFGSVEEKLLIGNNEMKDMLKSMKEIMEQSKKISNIIKTIDDIAFQTNILALNAAVEAARAGTSGKGFAVVADEVRSLASKSADSLKSTSEIIEKTLSIVQKGSANAMLTANTLSEIIDTSKTAIELIDGISEATHEENELISSIMSEVSHISKVVSDNSISSEQSNDISHKLLLQAEKLIDLTK